MRFYFKKFDYDMPDLDACIIKNCIHFGLQNGDKLCMKVAMSTVKILLYIRKVQCAIP